MQSARVWGLAFLMLLAGSAFASPIYGTWSGESNGQPVTLTFTRADNQTRGEIATTAAAARSISDFRMVRKASRGVYPFTVSFRAADASGNAVRYEIEQTSAGEATLRDVDHPDAPPVKLTKQK